MHCNCGKKVERLDIKIKCSDCKTYFHAICVNLTESDIDFMVKNKKPFRCEKCLVLRRKSLSQRSIDFIPIESNEKLIPNDNENNDIHNDGNEITLQIVYAEILKLKTLNGEAISLIKGLEKDNVALKCRVSELERKINFLQQSKRKKFVEFVGVPVIDNHNAVHSVIKICSDGLGVTVKEDDIDFCYVKQLKTKSNNEQNAQATGINNNKQSSYYSNVICAKFFSAACKRNIMSTKWDKKRNLNSGIFGNEFGNSRIFINDSLTSYNRALFKEASKLKSSHHYKYLWIRNSSILMRKSDGKPVIRIDSFEDLQKLVASCE